MKQNRKVRPHPGDGAGFLEDSKPKRQLQLALSIVSGRCGIATLSIEEYELLDFSMSSSRGYPAKETVLLWAEEIVYEAIVNKDAKHETSQYA